MLRGQIKFAQCWWQFHFWQKGWILAMSLQHPSLTVEKELSKIRNRTWLQLSCREPDDLQPQRLRSKPHLHFSVPFFIVLCHSVSDSNYTLHVISGVQIVTTISFLMSGGLIWRCMLELNPAIRKDNDLKNSAFLEICRTWEIQNHYWKRQVLVHIISMYYINDEKSCSCVK